ncbi:LysR family transcriptional regulator [Roseibium sediminicola]|uniref:LysR family transcriptional regulator n=1 Tax=Roseibium sediminicola TaxID=2933272 RepID=A0ABT0GTK3_9HYPH|nr:LysR family transcriptional regulator [Roseibium sp. CAU 1639]MCK7612767.1 LysR family transcriptional regulator [Roseibium sp. CAU 1639]
MLDDIALFIQIAQRRSLAAAAGHLGLPAATVTRRLRKLEEAIGAQLVHRSARKFSLTAEGEAYFEAFADLIVQAEITRRALSSDLHALQGALKVAAPTNISVGILQPMWSGFLKAHPDIRLTLTLSNENKDLLEHQVDLALRAGSQTDMRLYQQKLGSIATVLVAAPGYLEAAGSPLEPGDLSCHKLIKVVALARWELKHVVTGARETIHLNPFVTVDDIGLARQLAVDGHGLALLPVSEISGDLQTGRLVPVLSDWQGPGRDILVVWPTGRLLSARAKCLRDYISAHVSGNPVFQGTLP